MCWEHAARTKRCLFWQSKEREQTSCRVCNSSNSQKKVHYSCSWVDIFHQNLYLLVHIYLYDSSSAVTAAVCSKLLLQCPCRCYWQRVGWHKQTFLFISCKGTNSVCQKHEHFHAQQCYCGWKWHNESSESEAQTQATSQTATMSINSPKAQGSCRFMSQSSVDASHQWPIPNISEN